MAFSGGGGAQQNGSPDYDQANVIRALEAVHSPGTDNEVRQQASQYLEHARDSSQALQYGFGLSRDLSQAPFVRHFALSILERNIRHGEGLSEQQHEQLQNCVLELGQSLRDTDPSFLRNKVAGLWVEIAKRSWALDWFGLDELLQQLWSGGILYQHFVLTVLDSLSEDIFVREDATAVLRGRDLSSAMVEIMTAKDNYEGGLKIGEVAHRIRHGNDGWLSRISQFIAAHVPGDISNQAVKTTVLKAHDVLRSSFTWVMTPAIVHARAMEAVCSSLTVQDPSLVLSALDVLVALYGRHRLEEVEVHGLMYPMCEPEVVSMLRQLFQWSTVGPDDIDSAKYTISKKLAECVALIAEKVAQYGPIKDNSIDFGQFLELNTLIATHDSLIVSIAGMHSWEIVLSNRKWRLSEAVRQNLGPILQSAMSRVTQYDRLPDDTQEPAVIFVREEIELFPERQGFFLNYRKLCMSVIELICYAYPDEALAHIISETEKALKQSLLKEGRFGATRYTVSEQIIPVDTHFSVIEAAAQGCARCCPGPKQDSEVNGEESAGLVVKAKLREWYLDVMRRITYQDPLLKQRQIKASVDIANRLYHNDSGFAFSVLEQILAAFEPLTPAGPTYQEAMTELQHYATNELRRLVLQHIDYFATFYDQLEEKFRDLVSKHQVDEKAEIDLQSCLLLIVERASNINVDLRKDRLSRFLQPISDAWSNQSTQSHLTDFPTLVRAQGFDEVPLYMEQIQAVKIEDWSNVPLNDIGLRIQHFMKTSAVFPLRLTRTFLSVSTERLEHNTPTHSMICELWSSMLQLVLECTLRVISYSHQLHDALQWVNSLADARGPQDNRIAVVKRVLRDRYWQSGISEGTMHDFHSRIKSSRTSLEGLASSVRGRIRMNLEHSYSIVHTLGRLGDAFYSLPRMPNMVSECLIETTSPLRPHHFGILLLMLPKLIDECPPHHRQHFLTPLMASILRRMDEKCVSEWHELERRKQSDTIGDDLSEEMRDDSVLRQMTHRAVNMVSLWLNDKREQQLSNKRDIVNGQHAAINGTGPQAMRDFVLANPVILEPLLVFCNHILAIKDTKSCSTMLCTVTRMVPVFANDTGLPNKVAAEVREYISNEILRTAITSLHDGYFADYQPHLAQLIATIWLAYGLSTHIAATADTPAHDRPALSETPRNILMSLPGMAAGKVKSAEKDLMKIGINGNTKKLRAVILNLLEGVRGVRLSELGKIDTRKQQSRILEKYKQREAMAMQDVEEASHVQDNKVDLAGVADMFG